MKQEQLDALYADLKLHIHQYYKSEMPLVFGNGKPDSKIVLVGEAPGKNEVLQGKPFVGQAGKNLEEFIEILKIKREDLFITNVVKFRPYKVNPDTGRESNRPPTKEEIRISVDFLKKELAIIQPKIVVTLGNVALKCILEDEKASIGILHGSPLQVSKDNVKFQLFPLYHPASVIYNRDLRAVYLDDLTKLGEFLKTR